jgi:hypothetical protein
LVRFQYGLSHFSGIAFFADDLFIPPIPYWYVDYCPSLVRTGFCQVAQKDNIGRLGVYIDMATGIMGVTIGCRTFFNERVQFKRETYSGANKLAYFLAKILVDLEQIVVNTFAVVITFYFVAAPRGQFADYMVTVLLLQYCFFGLGYVVSWIFPNPQLVGLILALLTGLGTGNGIKSNVT